MSTALTHTFLCLFGWKLGRISTFLENYFSEGLTEWTYADYKSYAKAYAFGAYLLRNYGWAKLLARILANNLTNMASVTEALQFVNNDSGVSFEEALSHFGEALIFNGINMPTGVMSFDKTDDSLTINGKTYTAIRFDVWNDFSNIAPKIFSLTYKDNMKAPRK